MKLSDRIAQSTPPPPKRKSVTRSAGEPRSAASRAKPGRSKTVKSAASNGDGNSRRTAQPKAEKGHAARRAVHELVLAELAPQLTGPDALTGDELADEVKAAVDRIVAREDVEVGPLDRRRFVEDVLSNILGYGPLDALLADDDITEIMCNRHDQIWIERRGQVQATDVTFGDEEQYRQVIERIVSQVGRRVDEGSPMVDARLPDGSRVNAIVPPLSVRGPVLTIRKFPEEAFTAHDLVGFGTMTLDLGVFLEACVRAKLNVLVSGGTATGKTTFLNVLSAFIPRGDRIITIEDAAELRLQQPHIVTLEARPANAEGKGQVSIRDLVRNALRMRPDRIVVGEVRGAEALDMLQAMNTGHEGSLTTIHSNGPRDAMSRLETLVLMAGYDLPVRAIREQIAAAIDVIVQLERTADGRRVVVSVQEVQGLEDATIVLQELFAYKRQTSSDGRDTSVIEPTGLRPKVLDRIKEAGVELPMHVLQPGARRRATNGSGATATTPKTPKTPKTKSAGRKRKAS